MEEVKSFNGTMDLDSAPEYVAQGDYGEAYNIRIAPSDSHEGGRVNFNNNIVLRDDLELPEGDNKTLKTVVSDSLDAKFIFNFNSAGYHTLVKYTTGGGSLLFTDKLDTGGESLLEWDTETFINDAVLHMDRWIILTDGLGEVRLFDLQKLADGYGRAIVAQDLDLAKSPPARSPEFYYMDAPTLGYNNLRDKIFKFKYKYICEGGFETPWSPGSSSAIPNNLGSSIDGSQTNTQNVIHLNLFVEELGVEKVVVACSYDGSEWVIVREESISNLETLPSSSLDPLTETYYFGAWKMVLTDPYSYQLIPADDADFNYNAIPRSAKSLDIVNNNVLLLAGLPKNYPSPTQVDATLNAVNFDAGISSTAIGRGTLKVKRIDIIKTWGYPYYKESVYIEFEGTPTPGDIITIKFGFGMDGKPTGTTSPEDMDVYSYTVTSADTDLLVLYNSISRIVPDGTVNPGPPAYVGMRYPDAGDAAGLRRFKTLLGVDIDLADIGYSNVGAKRTFKKGSSVQFALSYRDKKGRYFPLVTKEDWKITFKNAAEESPLNGYEVDWTITGNPPPGAESYQWMVTEDSKHQKYFDVVGEASKPMSKKSKYITLDLTPFDRAEIRNIRELNYEYLPGDRVYVKTFWRRSSNTASRPAGLFLDLAVVGYTIEPETSTTSRHLLKIEYNDDLWNTLETTYTWDDSEESIALDVQIYSPKAIDPLLDTTLFKEVGPAYNVRDGEHSTTSGVLQGPSDYIRSRVFQAFGGAVARNFAIESKIPSDDKGATPAYKGNVRTLSDYNPDVDLSGSIRFSDIANRNSRYNGINKFYEGRIYGEGPGETTSKYGAITKIKVVGNYLKVLQEDEVGAIPVFLSMIQDNSGEIQTADSSKILNTVRYLGNGRIGTGSDAKSFAVSQGGTIFFFDNDRKVPYMFEGFTLANLSQKVGSYLSKYIDKVILGNYAHINNLFKQYWMTFSDKSGQAKTLVFEHGQNGWRCFSDNIPEAVANLNDSVYCFKGGRRYVLSKSESHNEFYGVSHNSYLSCFFASGFVRTFQSLAVHGFSRPDLVVDGITTELGQVSELYPKNYKQKEGIFYADFWRDKLTGLANGKFLKGKWMKLKLKFDPTGYLNLSKIVVKSKVSTPNE